MLYADEFLTRLETALRAALPIWDIDPAAPLRLLTYSENATFLVDTPRRLVLRVYRPGYHSPAEIESELAWITALREDDIVATPRPVAGRDGTLLQSFADGDTRRHAACFEHVPGVEPAAEHDLPRWFHHLGAIAARLHHHARHFVPPDGFTRKRWTWDTIIGPGAHWGDWRAAPDLDAEGHALLERVSAALRDQTAALGLGPAQFGLIHGDMRAANLLVDGPRLTVIDFDDCGFGWFGFDFAAAVSFIETDPIVPALQAAWTAGYRTVAPLDPVTEAALPMLVMLRRLQLTAWLASHSETPTARALPDYTQGTLALAQDWLAQHAP